MPRDEGLCAPEFDQVKSRAVLVGMVQGSGLDEEDKKMLLDRIETEDLKRCIERVAAQTTVPPLPSSPLSPAIYAITQPSGTDSSSVEEFRGEVLTGVCGDLGGTGRIEVQSGGDKKESRRRKSFRAS